MIGQLTVTDIIELVALCAIVFIPFGHFVVPQLGRMFRRWEWRFGSSMYFKRKGSLAKYAQIDESGTNEQDSGK